MNTETSATASSTPPECPYDANNSTTTTANETNPKRRQRWLFSNHEYPSNQMRNPQQRKPLSTTRLESTIPRTAPEDSAPASSCRGQESDALEGGEGKGQNWVYPSEQMFFNALRRKGYTHINEEDMKAVVAIHNTVNERAWRQVLDWECDLHPDTCADVKLAFFKGKPKDLSPKARFKNWIGYTLPFDRHDWTIDRGNGELVRYVIDFYNGKQVPGMPASVFIDTRPALDSVTSVFDRFRMFMRRRGIFASSPSDDDRKDGGRSP